MKQYSANRKYRSLKPHLVPARAMRHQTELDHRFQIDVMAERVRVWCWQTVKCRFNTPGTRHEALTIHTACCLRHTNRQILTGYFTCQIRIWIHYKSEFTANTNRIYKPSNYSCSKRMKHILSCRKNTRILTYFILWTSF